MKTHANTILQAIPTLISDKRFQIPILAITKTKEHGAIQRSEASFRNHSLGELANGESFGIYRMMLFVDGFQPHPSSNTSYNAECMFCYNLSTIGLSPVYIHPITIIHPNVCTDKGFLHLKNDLIDDAVNGRVITDGEAQKPRIFRDFLGVVADNLALNQMLDTMGTN